MEYRLVAFDMDGTLVRGTTSNLHYARLLGVEEQIVALEERFARGEVDSRTFAAEASQIMRQLDAEFIFTHFTSLPVVSGIERTVRCLLDRGIIPIIATTSNVMYARCFQERYGFSHVFGTEHEILAGGRVGPGLEICSSDGKVRFVEALAAQYGIPMEQVVAVGDSVSDIPLFRRVGKAVAFNYQPCLEGLAAAYVRSADLWDVVPHIVEEVSWSR